MRSAGDVLSAMVASFTTGQVDDVATFVDADYVDHQGLSGEAIGGVAGFAHVVEVARSGYETLVVRIEDLIVEGDRVAARLRWTGTRDGSIVERESLEIVHVREGRAVDHWGGRS